MYELRRILVPTDFSKHADEALEHAVYLGARYEPEIVLLHVDEFPVSPLGSRGVLDATVRAYQDRKAAFYEEQFAGYRRTCRDARCVSFRRSFPAVHTR